MLLATLSRPAPLVRHASPLLARLYSTPSSLVTAQYVAAPHTGHIKILTLTRPDARNAISRRLLHELKNHVSSTASEPASGPTRALILASGLNSTFCSGADLKERSTFTAEETASFLAELRGTFNAIAALPIPTISAVGSLALGGGLELALTTHMRVFASTAQVSLPETRLGIVPGAGGTYRLPALIGLPRARDMILTGRRVSGAEAYFLGIADRLVEVVPEAEGQEIAENKAREMVLQEAVRLAEEICLGAPVATRAALHAVGWAREEVENKAYESVVGTQDRDEALLAFKEKRRPMFKGC